MRGSWPCIARQANCAAILPRGASHYVFEPNFCNPAAGWEKGQVEKNVRYARRAESAPPARRLWQVMPAFSDLDALNDWLEERCKVLWAETAHGTLSPSHTCKHVLPVSGQYCRCLGGREADADALAYGL
jgi:transposase